MNSHTFFPAFPLPQEWDDDRNGMTLRDYFAAASLTGIKANNDLLKMITEQTRDDGITLPEAIAIMAYKDADAMLKQRSL